MKADEAYAILKDMIDEGKSGTKNYNDLSNKPKINNVELAG